ncbi:25836_t:CDS:2 [Racocetra persica]|uniref:25836_t:CDS:1 n=1 Tax=Racocetra persica TaxID=160502 RepID=A0ACA9KBU1_9GLOM|nr:25836_t:CDS:2 [Racocetra persica]
MFLSGLRNSASKTSNLKIFCTEEFVQVKFVQPSAKPSIIEENSKKIEPEYSSWLYTYLPPKLVPYALLARLDKPIGTWLLYLPCSKSFPPPDISTPR